LVSNSFVRNAGAIPPYFCYPATAATTTTTTTATATTTTTTTTPIVETHSFFTSGKRYQELEKLTYQLRLRSDEADGFSCITWDIVKKT